MFFIPALLIAFAVGCAVHGKPADSPIFVFFGIWFMGMELKRNLKRITKKSAEEALANEHKKGGEET